MGQNLKTCYISLWKLSKNGLNQPIVGISYVFINKMRNFNLIILDLWENISKTMLYTQRALSHLHMAKHALYYSIILQYSK